MSSELQKVSPKLRNEITDILYQESYYLDNRRYKQWLDLLTDDVLYQMHMRETVEGVNAENISLDSFFYNESKVALITRVNRLYTKSAWVENPATRQRHFISNIMIEATANPEEYKVRSYFLYKRSRGSTVDVEQLFGERNDILRKVNGEWKIASRIIYPDQAVITTMNMSMFI